VAVAKGAAAGGSTLIILKALKIMAWTQAKTAMAVGLAVVLFAAGTTVTVREIQAHKTYPWQEGKRIDIKILDQIPPQLRILPHKSHPNIGWGSKPGKPHDAKLIGQGVDFKILIQAAYAYTYGTKHLERIIPLVPLPPGRFDFIATLPAGNPEALQQEIKRQFGLRAKLETRATDVLLLTVKSPNASGLRPSAQHDGRGGIRQGRLDFRGAPMDWLRQNLEDYFHVPVLDRTGLAGDFDMAATWEEPVQRGNPDGLRAALTDQLGLELAPSREPLEVLVIEKAD
jgi:uncharacterized protein (TIGR03435 family)